MKDDYAELKRALEDDRPEPAQALCRELLAREPESVELLVVMGALSRRTGDLEGALEAFSRAVGLDPAQAELRNNLGVVLQDLGRHEEAAARYGEALSIRGGYAQAHVNLGNALLKLNRHEEAIRAYSDAIAADPAFVDAYYNLGNTLRGAGEWEGSVQCYKKAVELHPAHLDARVNLGGALFALNRLAEAQSALSFALELDPQSVDAHWNLALVLLTTGDYRRGWQEYEWRLKDDKARFCEGFAGKGLWDGSPLDGRTLLLRAEQGFGDAIQFFRYAQLLARRGERVVLECRRELLPLFAAQESAIACFAAGGTPPFFDTFAYLMSLPGLLGTTPETIPRETPLKADPGRVSLWRERIGAGSPTVGLVWAGSAGYKNDRYRSLRAADLAPVSGLPGIRLYSLQLGDAARELPLLGAEVVDLAPGIRDFADTAAIIENLDLVLSVDTAVAHLAGAMGKPVLIMLPFSCEWRWFHGRADSPWYPTARLIRQERMGEWADVVAAVKRELASLLPREAAAGPAPRDTPRARQPEPEGTDEDVEWEFQRANGLRLAGDPAAAASIYLRLSRRLPGCAAIWNNLGLAREDQGLSGEAEASFRRALELDPGLADAHNNLGTLLVSRGEHEAARPHFEAALGSSPAYLPALVNLGSCLQVLEEPRQAIELYLRAMELQPAYLEARINLGTAWQDLMRPEKAIAAYEEILALDPGHPEAHWNLALSLLSVGAFERGWREYEWRLAGEEDAPALPVWRGEELSGRTILIECEQGLGDTLQFVRYAPLVAKRGGEVLLWCQIPALKPLLSRVPGVAAVFCRDEAPPRCDCRVKLLSLPHIFGTTLSRMPPWQPYLLPEPRRAALWELMLEAGGNLKVGLVWRGGALPRNRACPFPELAALAGVRGVSFFSLQLGEAPDPGVLDAADLAPQIGDFGDSAAILAGLDLLLSVDTAAAHLAGGMGVPVWLMLPWSCDWRWMPAGETSPWYPSLTVFRQERPGDWQGVLGRVRAALEGLVRCR